MGKQRIVRSEGVLEVLHQNIWSYLEDTITSSQHLPALECSQSGRVYSYEDVLQGSQNWAQTFLSLSKGHKPPTLAIISSNSVEIPIIALGGIRSGSPVLMIQHDLSHDVHAMMLEDSDTSIIITDFAQLDSMQKVIEALPGRSFEIFVNGLDESDERSVAKILKRKTNDTYVQKEIHPEDIALVFYSSGTTGKPKGVIHSHNGIVNELYLAKKTFNSPPKLLEKQIVKANYSPLAHTAGLMNCIMALDVGSKMVIAKGFDLQDTLETTRKFKPPMVFLRPHFLDYISHMDNASSYLGEVKVLCNVGAALCKTTAERLKEKLGPHIKVKNCYASTESGAVCYTPLTEERPDQDMTLVPNTELRIVDINTGEDLGPNQHGEMLLRSPRLFKGYLNNPTATREALDSEGWFHTGDAGFYDQDHYITHLERIKDVIRVKGVKIFPSDIEDILIGHPSVLEAGVAGLPDRESGEVPKAFVVRASGELTQEELMRYVNERVKRPEEILTGILFIDSLPRSHTGKIQRKFLREKAWRI